MRKLLTFALLIITLNTTAQSLPLPYSTGFDSLPEQQGWTSYRLGNTAEYDWSYMTNPCFSAPNSLLHDYPLTGSVQDPVEDWYVSPPLNFTGYGLLKLKVFGFTMSGLTNFDYFGIWFSEDDGNPANGNFIEMADLTDHAVNPASQWNETASIQLPFITQAGYIALVYKAANNWFTVNVDDISVILESPVGTEQDDHSASLKVFPNPTAGDLHLRGDAAEGYHLRIYDLTGNQVKQTWFTGSADIGCADLAPGIYLYQATSASGHVSAGKITLF